MIRTAARAAADKKAFEIVALEVPKLTSYTDALLICSGGRTARSGPSQMRSSGSSGMPAGGRCTSKARRAPIGS